MKKYKEYIDRISLSDEAHNKILEALAREAEKPAEGPVTPANTEALKPAPAKPWYKKPAVIKWGSFAAVFLILLLVGVSAVTKQNRVQPTATSTAGQAAWNPTLAAPTQALPNTATPPKDTAAPQATAPLQPTMAGETTLTPTMAPATTMASPPTQETAVIPTMAPAPVTEAYLCDSSGVETPLTEEDIRIIENLFYKARYFSASGSPGLLTEDYFEEVIPDGNASWKEPILKINQGYYRFLPEKADDRTIDEWEALLKKYGLTSGTDK